MFIKSILIIPQYFALKDEEDLDPEDIEDEQYTLETRSKCKQNIGRHLLASRTNVYLTAYVHVYCNVYT